MASTRCTWEIKWVLTSSTKYYFLYQIDKVIYNLSKTLTKIFIYSSNDTEQN